MKKIFTMICVAAAALVGCQNVDENLNEGTLGGNSFKATASTPKLSRTELVYDGSAYKAQWCEGDQVALIEVATVDAENATIVKYESNALTAATESAEFSFNVDAATANSYQYVLVYPYDNVGIADATAVNLTLATNQVKKDASFGANCDLLIAKSDVLTTQPESVAFSLTRLSAVAKMTLKNLAIPAGEVIEDVTLSCEQPLTGTIGVNYADFSWSVVSGVNSITTTNYEWAVVADGTLDVYFSVLPATLAAGESYTITVETDKATYIKEATLASGLQFKAGDITTFSANMNGAASKTKLANLSENCEYAIGFTHTETGKVYLINRTAIAKNPTVQELSTLGATLDAKGTIVGEIAKAYRWNYKNDGGHQFYYITGSGNECHLIAGNKNQGIAVMSKNANGVYSGAYNVEYTDIFKISVAEGGYDITYGELENRDLDVDPNNGYVNAPGKNTLGVWNFYRIQAAPYETLYPVITKASQVSEGTYVIMAKKTVTDADTNETTITYYALPNAFSVTAPTAVTADKVSIALDENTGYVSAANVSNDYKWIIKKMETKDAWNIMSAVDKTLLYWQRENAGGQVVCSIEYKEENNLSGKFKSDWTFFNDAAKGMQARTSGGAEKNRHLWVNGSGVWANATSATDALVLVKLSNSTEQIQ